MVFAAPKLRLHPKLGRPTVIIVVDRIDLDTQITGDITADLSEQDHDDLATSCTKMAVLGKNLGCVRAVVQHRGTHFQTKVEPNGFKAPVVMFDRKCCALEIQHCLSRRGRATCLILMSGRSVAWLARLFRVQEVVSSNLTAPTIFQFLIYDLRFGNPRGRSK